MFSVSWRILEYLRLTIFSYIPRQLFLFSRSRQYNNDNLSFKRDMYIIQVNETFTKLSLCMMLYEDS